MNNSETTSTPEQTWPEILTIEQVAEYLQLHPQVVYRHVRAGTLPASRIGRTIRFKKSVLDQWLESGAWKSAGRFMRFLETSRGAGVRAAQARAIPPEKNDDAVETVVEPRRRFSVDVD
jgi:excisionase family DNA binding protein